MTFSHGEGNARSFAVVDPDEVTPTASPRSLVLAGGDQRVSVEGIQPAGGNVTIELDATDLETHGVAVDDLDADASTDGATVERTAVDDGVVSVVVSPAPDAALIDVHLTLGGFDARSIDDDRVHATDVVYGVRLDGAAADPVEVEPFDVLASTPTPVAHHASSAAPDVEAPAEDQPADAPAEAPLGLAVPFVGIAVAALLVARRR